VIRKQTQRPSQIREESPPYITSEKIRGEVDGGINEKTEGTGTSEFQPKPWWETSKNFRNEFEANARLINKNIKILFILLAVIGWIIIRIIVFLTKLFPNNAGDLLDSVFKIWR